MVSIFEVRTLISTLVLAALFFGYANQQICSPSVSSSNAIIREQYYLSGVSDFRAYDVLSGTVSDNIYYLDVSYVSPNRVVVRKVNTDNSLIWIAAFSGIPAVKGLALDLNEINVYFVYYASYLSIFKLNASDGSLVFVKNFPSLTASSYDIKVFPLDDNSGFTFITNKAGTSHTNLCKYLISSPSNTQCNEIPFMNQYASNQLKISDSQYFIIGIDTLSPKNLHLLTINTGSTSPLWVKKISCPSSSCSLVGGDSFLDSNNKIYSYFTYGSPSTYLQLATLNSTDGSIIGSRFLSNSVCSQVWSKMALSNYILAIGVSCGGYNLVLYSTETDEFTIKRFSGSYVFSFDKERLSGRFILVGQKSSKDYITKFKPEVLSFHPDFISTTMTMTIQVSGSYDISSDSGISISSATNEAVSDTTSSYSNLTVTIVLSVADSFTSPVLYQTSPQSYLNLIENNYYELNPDLPCSTDILITISYSLSGYNKGSVPSWVSIDSISGLLKISTPVIYSNHEDYAFYINSFISGQTDSVLKIIKLQINKCSVQNCEKCSEVSSDVCTACSINFTLSSGKCISQQTNSSSKSSETSSASSASSTTSLSNDNSSSLATVVKILVGVTAVCSGISSAANSSSPMSLWTMINNLQMLFLIVLTKIYLPTDVVNVILGSKFILILFDQIPVRNSNLSSKLLNFFKTDQDNSKLFDIGIESGSSIINLYSFFLSLFVTIILHLVFKLTIQLHIRYESRFNCCFLYRIVIWMTLKALVVLTFSYYIRCFLEMHQYILLSSISEVKRFETNSGTTIASLATAISMLVLCVLMIILSFWLAMVNFRKKEKDHHKLDEFCEGIKEKRSAKLYTMWVMIRRILLIIIALFAPTIFLRILLMTIIQFIYFVNLAFQRPFQSFKNNFGEILSEILYLFYFCFLFPYNSENKWTPTSINAYKWMIISSSLSICLISIIEILVIAIKFCKFIKPAKTYPKHVTAQSQNVLAEEVKENLDHSAIRMKDGKSFNSQINK